MGTVYKICDCKNKDTRPEEKFATYNFESNKKIFFRNNNNSSIKTLNSSSKNTKDTLEPNIAANLIIKNYKLYKGKKNNKIELKNKILYDKNDNINKPNHNLVINESFNEHNYSSYLSNNSNLKRMKNLKNKDFLYIGGKSANGLKEGFGITIWNNHPKHIGNYKNNKPEGYGKFIYDNDKYLGEFKDGTACGFGIYNHEDEVIYTGYWFDDLEENYGIEKWKDGSEYKGQFSEGKKHGIGTYIWNDGSKYEGNWNKNIMEGFGIKYYNKRKVYIGEWKNNLKDGFGEFLFVGRKYIGFFSKDQIEGFGIYYWAKTNKAYMGFWKNGKQFGFGKFMTRNNRKYGNWTTHTQVNWFKTEEEAFDFMENKGLNSYKAIFLFSLDDIRNYCINNDEFNELLN